MLYSQQMLDVWTCLQRDLPAKREHRRSMCRPEKNQLDEDICWHILGGFLPWTMVVIWLINIDHLIIVGSTWVIAWHVSWLLKPTLIASNHVTSPLPQPFFELASAGRCATTWPWCSMEACHCLSLRVRREAPDGPKMRRHLGKNYWNDG